VSKCGWHRIACGQKETINPANPKPLGLYKGSASLHEIDGGPESKSADLNLRI